MNWIRVAVAIGDDPDVHLLAAAVGVRVAEAVGLVVGLLTKFPEHAPDGSLAKVPDSLVERWAGWEGDRGAFAVEFRRLFLTEDGVWSAWDKHNGAAMRDAQASRERAAEYRRRQANSLLDSTANGTPNGAADGSHLRTDGRTNKTTGRASAKTATYAPGHLNLSSAPFCPECGDGELREVEGQRRPVRCHLPTCSHAEAA